jgi:hypothetical protein
VHPLLISEFLCLIADPLDFEDPPPVIQVATQNRCWLDIIAVTACFLRGVCPTPPPLTPPYSHAHACSNPGSADPATTADSLDCSLVSVSLLIPPLEPQGRCFNPSLHEAVPLFLSVLWKCSVLWIWSVTMKSPSLVYMSRPLSNLLMPWSSPLQTVMMKFTFRVSRFCPDFV